MPALPMPLAWLWLYVPMSVDPMTDVKTLRLAEYTSSRQGSIQSDFPSMMWTHFALGRCTTHVAERFLNGVNGRFGTAHLSMRMFLEWLQKFELEVQSRGLQLLAGRPPKQRPEFYTSNGTTTCGPQAAIQSSVWPDFLQLSLQHYSLQRFHVATAHYLSRVSYLLRFQ